MHKDKLLDILKSYCIENPSKEKEGISKYIFKDYNDITNTAKGTCYIYSIYEIGQFIYICDGVCNRSIGLLASKRKIPQFNKNFVLDKVSSEYKEILL